MKRFIVSPAAIREENVPDSPFSRSLDPEGRVRTRQTVLSLVARKKSR
jgi:hypothetical protein